MIRHLDKCLHIEHVLWVLTLKGTFLMKLLIFIFLTFFITSNSSQAQTPKDMLSFDRILKETKENNFVKVLERFKTSYGIKLIIEVNTDDLTSEEIESFSISDVFGAKEVNTSTTQFKILKLTDGRNYDYLIFSNKNNEFYYIGDIFIFSKYENPDIKYFKVKGKYFLLLNEFGSGGTGANDTLTSFYVLKENKLKKILTISTKGHVVGWPTSFDRKFKSKINTNDLQYNKLSIEYFISYTAPIIENKGSENLFNIKKTLSMVFDEEKNEFIHEKDKSELTLKDVENIYNQDEEGFYNSYKKEIEDLMKNGNKIQKKWCSEFLNQMKEPNESQNKSLN